MAGSERPVAVLRQWKADDGRTGERLYMWCPACDAAHAVEVREPNEPRWQWDGNLKAPTISPSILVHNQNRCHSIVTAGTWNYCDDSAHSLAGRSASMIPLPDWLVR